MLNFTFVHSSCYSNIGRTGGEQDISLMGACLKTGTAVHEMMHALGFWHEQSRPDRDTWVHVIQSNIQEGKGHNSHSRSREEIECKKLYLSIHLCAIKRTVCS